MGIHADHGDLDGTYDVKVVVAKVVSRSFEVILVEGTGIVYYFVQDWLSCTRGDRMRYQDEIEYIIALLFNYSSVNNSAGTRVEDLLVLLVKETKMTVAIYQTEDNFRLVRLRTDLQHVGDDFHLMILDFISHIGTTHAISIYDNLLREFTGILLIVPESLTDEVLNDLSSLNCGQDLLDFSFFKVCIH